MIYIAIQHVTDDGESLYKAKTLHTAFQFIHDRNLTNFTISDISFLDEKNKEIPEQQYELIN